MKLMNQLKYYPEKIHLIYALLYFFFQKDIEKKLTALRLIGQIDSEKNIFKSLYLILKNPAEDKVSLKSN